MTTREFSFKIIKIIVAYALAAAGIIFLFNCVIMLNVIPSGSMNSTIPTGSLVVASRYDKTQVDRYDIMVFIPPDDPDSYYIKRVIGLPGETIVVKDGKVYADGVELDDSFIQEEAFEATDGDGTYEVPEGCYFMLGDNRNHSLDARFWDEKYVPLENMVAKAQILLFPFSDIGSLEYQAS